MPTANFRTRSRLPCAFFSAGDVAIAVSLKAKKRSWSAVARRSRRPKVLNTRACTHRLRRLFGSMQKCSPGKVQPNTIVLCAARCGNIEVLGVFLQNSGPGLQLQNHSLAAEFAKSPGTHRELGGVPPAFRTFGCREQPKSAQGCLERVRKAGGTPPISPCPNHANATVRE